MCCYVFLGQRGTLAYKGSPPQWCTGLPVKHLETATVIKRELNNCSGPDPTLSSPLSYVYHSAGVSLDPAYSDRVKFLGQPGTKICSLQISGIRKSDGGAYVFYAIPSHPTQKMPPQTGVQLLVAGRPGFKHVKKTDLIKLLKGTYCTTRCEGD